MGSTPTVLRCPILVGRDAELSVLESAVSRAGTAPSAVFVDGVAGVGKTRLVGEASQRARSRGCLVLTGRCSRAEQDVPYRALTEAFLAATRDLDRPMEDGLAPFVAVLGSVVPHWTDVATSSASESPLAVGEGICRLLRHVAPDIGLLLVIEDLHWADAETVRVLAYLVHHLEGSRATVVLTARRDEPGGPPLDAVIEGCVQVLHLGPLDDDAVEQMARACAGDASLDEDALAALRRNADGLPLLVEDLVAAPSGVGPMRFADIVRARLDALVPSAQQLLIVAALAGDTIDIAVLGAATGATRADLAATLHEGARHQLVVSIDGAMRFRHALTAQVVRDQLPSTERAEVAAALATALTAREHPEHARAAELWELAGNHDAAGDAFLLAAADAAASGSLVTAERLCRRAVDVGSADVRRRGVDQLLSVLLTAGQFDRVRIDGARALDAVAPSSPHATSLHLALAQASLQQGDDERAAMHLTAARRNGTDLPILAARLRLLEAHHALATEEAQRVDAAGHLAGQAVGLAEAAGDPALLCEALELLALCARSRSLTDGLVPLERMLRTAEEHQLPLWRIRALNEIGAIDLLRDASADRLLRAREAARSLGAPATTASIELNLAALHVMRGETAEAHERVAVVEDLAVPLGLTPMAAAAVMIDGMAHGHEGDTARMEACLREAERLAPSDSDMLSLAWAAGRGITALLREDRAGARRAFEKADAYPAPARTLNPARGPLLLLRAMEGDDVTDLIDAAAGEGSPDARYPHMWLGFAQAVARGRAGMADDATDAFRAADELARPYRLFGAVARRLVAEAAIRDHWGTPVAWLRDAEAEFVTRASPAIASACRSLLKQAGEQPTRRRSTDANVPADLLRIGVTAREAEVLDLVAQRLTNREIADRLFMSPRTVEKHVAALLRKTATANRNDLAFYSQHR